MIVHCTRKLAAKLPAVSAAAFSPEGMLVRAADVLDLDPLAVARYLNGRPSRAAGVLHWPAREMLALVAAI